MGLTLLPAVDQQLYKAMLVNSFPYANTKRQET